MDKNNIPQELNKNLKDLNENIKKSNSFWLGFLRGIAGGIGTAIGATIIAAIVITILAKTIHSVEYVPILNKIIKNTNIESIIQKDE